MVDRTEIEAVIDRKSGEKTEKKNGMIMIERKMIGAQMRG